MPTIKQLIIYNSKYFYREELVDFLFAGGGVYWGIMKIMPMDAQRGHAGKPKATNHFEWLVRKLVIGLCWMAIKFRSHFTGSASLYISYNDAIEKKKQKKRAQIRVAKMPKNEENNRFMG